MTRRGVGSALRRWWRSFLRMVAEYNVAFLIAFALVLLAFLGAPRFWLAVAPAAIGLAFVLFWGLRSGASRESGRKRAASLRTVLYRTVLVAMLGLLALVFFVQWWSARSAIQEPDAWADVTVTAALGQLDLAWEYQPARIGDASGYGDVPGVSDRPFRRKWTGTWLTYDAYSRIRTIIERFPDNGGAAGIQVLQLGRRDAWAPRHVFTPAQLRSWNGSSSDYAIVGVSNWDAIRRIGGLYPDAPSAAYLRRHGWYIGSGLDTAEHDEAGHVVNPKPYHWAVWRTGPDSLYVVESMDVPHERKSRFTPRRALQALYLFLFLAPAAGLTALYLNRRLVEPVASVAAASEALAAGSPADPIPEDGPEELATMAQSFNRLSERLDEAEAAQREFVASVNHELKTPLTSLQGYGELLSDGAVSAEEAGPVVLAETARLERLVGDLLDSARLDSGTFSVRREDVSLAHVAEAVLRRYQATAQEFGVSLNIVRQGSGDAVVLADADRLVQVVGNLTENALRCTPSGGAVEIVLAASATLRVVDSGPGIAEEDVPHAFERFFLYEKYGKERPVGTGLGLSIVRELVVAMGGTVSVLSNPGGGTAFTVELRPAGDEPATVGDPASGSPAENL